MRAMLIGKQRIDPPVILAPMAGVTDKPFRQLCKRLGAGLAVSEMTISDPRFWNTQKSLHRMDHDGEPTPVSVQIAEQALIKAKLPANIVIDCSHANSYKKTELQPLVMADVVNQVRFGNTSLVGVMIESNLVAGNQPIPDDLSELKYGCSVTDACVDWATTETMIREMRDTLRPNLSLRSAG